MAAISGDGAAVVRPPRILKCSRCRNHGLQVPVRGHAGRCGWKTCNCPKCSLITERRKIRAACKLLKAETEEPPASKKGRGKAWPTERSGNTARSPAQAESAGPSLSPLEHVPTLDYERETLKMHFSRPPMYHYPEFPAVPGFPSGVMPPPTYPSTTPHPVFPFRGVYPYYPFQDGGRGFYPSYYQPTPQSLPQGYLPGLHYIPLTVPMNIRFMPEPRKSLTGLVVPENQYLKIASESSETTARDKST
ncbi:doublesex- and mab-3-related transcription factor B1 [Dendropsophus ebraccatus]|uniref:doublesex- and mab-3-related transcription factor B1 n=1 Tax=Dendropsophus ebraccatus TaxID=150705 RepID=UPI003831BA7C